MFIMNYRCFHSFAWVKPLKDKKGKSVLNAFIEIASESNRNPNTLWVDQWLGFYNKPMQEWSDNKNFLLFSTHNKSETVIADGFINKWHHSICKSLVMLIILLCQKKKAHKLKINDKS